MHFQSDEEPGSSEITAERGEREEMLRHFVPVYMISDRRWRGGGGRDWLYISVMRVIMLHIVSLI